MNIKNLWAFLVLLASPRALFASSETDREIEETAKASCHYRTALEDQIAVKAPHGVVTLSSTVPDGRDKDIAADSMKNLPGFTSGKNGIAVREKSAMDENVGEKTDGVSMASTAKCALLNHVCSRAIKAKITANDQVNAVIGKTSFGAETFLLSISLRAFAARSWSATT